jgi:hypothetical protein
MPKPDDRGSLMNLKTNLPRIAAVRTTDEMERHLLGAEPERESGEEIFTNVKTSVRKEDSSVTATSDPPPEPNLKGSTPRREGTILLNAKIPVSLHTRLKRTAQYNDVSMTDILVRGINSELSSGKYRTPPSTWGTDSE